MPDSDVPLQILVGQLLLGRTDGLSASGVAAFLLGWSSVLEILRRPDVALPDASQETRQALVELVKTLEQAQRVALSDGDDDADG